MSKIYGSIYESQKRYDIIGLGTNGDTLNDLTKSELRQLMVDIQCSLQLIDVEKHEPGSIL